MNFLELASMRQSCRAYAPTPVPRELIDSCLEAARLAPSACNAQPWSFIVVDRDPLRTDLARACSSGIYSLNKFALHAPVLISVVTERSKYAARLGGLLRRVQYALIDIGIAGDHLTLRAAELGLGTCWLGWFNEKEAKTILGLPRSSRLDIIFTLGYPTDNRIRIKQRKSLDEIRRYA